MTEVTGILAQLNEQYLTRIFAVAPFGAAAFFVFSFLAQMCESHKMKIREVLF